MSSTPYILQSYASGQWHTPTQEGKLLQHAVTGEGFAHISSSGLSFSTMLDYARTLGTANLQAYTFHQRALMLKKLAAYLLTKKEIFYQCSYATGATRSDAWIDIEGGIGTLFSFSSKARIEMPNDTLYIDGAFEQLSRRGSFVGQHIYTPIKGAAIQINAYNFPCWGMLEKLAPAFIAGLPSIFKPASQSAFLTELMVKHIIDSNILPKGALQLICGSTGDLLDYVDYQDVVSFTGSATTGLMLKQHPVIAKENTRFMMEADSLNCCILGEDVNPDSNEFALFIKEVVKEISTKAGQKCTAIRRILVPKKSVSAVCQALQNKLAKIRVGNPLNENVGMGALAGLPQRQEVFNAVQQLQADSECVFGNLDPIELIDADYKKGAFMSSILMLNNQSHTAKAHDIEAFGPVSTILPYKNTEDAIALAAKGKGSLVGSLITNSAEVARQIALGIAPHHGRILILNQSCAKESTGHGSPLPQLIHGGPGRAGASEEQGGVRGIKHYMQRTALQGSPDMLSAITNSYLPGATRNETQIHPFKKYFEELEVGDTIITEKRKITLEIIDQFAALSGDTFYAHTNEEAAKRNPFFDGRVAHGYLLVSIAAGLFVWPEEGPVLANTGLENLSFQKPVYAGDTIQVQFTCKQKKNRLTEIWGEVRWDTTIINQNNEICAQYDVLTGVANITTT